MYDPTNQQDELNRKTLHSINELITARQANQISDSVFAVGAKSVWMATSGLVSDGVQEVVDQVLNESQKCRCEMVFADDKGNSICVCSKALDVEEIEVSIVLVKSSPEFKCEKKIINVPAHNYQNVMNNLMSSVKSKGLSLTVGAKL